MLSIENLSVEYYRRGLAVPAVQGISLNIQPGEAVGLVGESGSGKSTVVLAILRLIRAQEGKITSGKILFKGQDLLALPEDGMRAVRGKRISMIFQDPFTSFNPVMRIREQMEEVGTGLEEALSRVQLDPARILNAYPHQLSGGQRQRVAIATALLNKPDLLLADEPTTALDVIAQKQILDLLFRLQRETAIAVLFISHNLALMAQYAQRIVILSKGRLIEAGPFRQVFDHPQHAYTRQLINAIPAFKR